MLFILRLLHDYPFQWWSPAVSSSSQLSPDPSTFLCFCLLSAPWIVTNPPIVITLIEATAHPSGRNAKDVLEGLRPPSCDRTAAAAAERRVTAVAVHICVNSTPARTTAATPQTKKVTIRIIIIPFHPCANYPTGAEANAATRSTSSPTRCKSEIIAGNTRRSAD